MEVECCANGGRVLRLMEVEWERRMEVECCVEWSLSGASNGSILLRINGG